MCLCVCVCVCVCVCWGEALTQMCKGVLEGVGGCDMWVCGYVCMGRGRGVIGGNGVSK